VTAAPSLKAIKQWSNRHSIDWCEEPITPLEYREAIRDQAVGIAWAADDLERFHPDWTCREFHYYCEFATNGEPTRPE
jgi:hypothetical protein